MALPASERKKPWRSMGLAKWVSRAARAAATVAFVPVAGAQGYEAAFERLLTTCEADVIATDCSDADALSALGAALCTQGTRECVAFAGLSDPSLAELRNLAEALNCERLGLLGPDVRYAGETSFGGGCLAAAAMAGLVCAQDDPALPLSGAALQGLDAVSTALVESEIDTLVHAGVIPLEQVGGQVRIIRAVTTRTATEGVPDATWRELSTVMIVDDVIPAVRDALSAKFLRRKNTAVTRNAIRAQTAIILDDRVRRQIIEEYDSLTVEPSACRTCSTRPRRHFTARREVRANENDQSLHPVQRRHPHTGAAGKNQPPEQGGADGGAGLLLLRAPVRRPARPGQRAL